MVGNCFIKPVKIENVLKSFRNSFICTILSQIYTNFIIPYRSRPYTQLSYDVFCPPEYGHSSQDYNILMIANNNYAWVGKNLKVYWV